jgi:hypothetical protein
MVVTYMNKSILMKMDKSTFVYVKDLEYQIEDLSRALAEANEKIESLYEEKSQASLGDLTA